MSNTELNPFRFPIQPLETDKHGILRFRENKCVVALMKQVEALGGSWSECLYADGVETADRVQFAQLHGYSLSGFGDLGHVPETDLQAAREMHEAGKSELQARHEVLERQLNTLKNLMRPAVSELYGVCVEFD